MNGPLRRVLIWLGWILGIPALLAAGLIAWGWLDMNGIHTRIPDRYLIPKGYVGQVKIQFSASGTPGLQIENRRRIFPIGSDGTLRTSSNYEDTYRHKGYGWAKDDYFYVDGGRLSELRNCGWCEEEMIWTPMFEYPHQGGPPTENLAGPETFFVGTRSDFCKLDPERVYNVCK